MRGLLQAGYITSTGGGQREGTSSRRPPLNIDEGVLFGSISVIVEQISKLG